MQDKPRVIGFLRSVVEKDRGTRLGIDDPLTPSGVAPQMNIIFLPSKQRGNIHEISNQCIGQHISQLG
jgi:hypothetical protein